MHVLVPVLTYSPIRNLTCESHRHENSLIHTLLRGPRHLLSKLNISNIISRRAKTAKTQHRHVSHQHQPKHIMNTQRPGWGAVDGLIASQRTDDWPKSCNSANRTSLSSPSLPHTPPHTPPPPPLNEVAEPTCRATFAVRHRDSDL